MEEPEDDPEYRSRDHREDLPRDQEPGEREHGVAREGADVLRERLWQDESEGGAPVERRERQKIEHEQKHVEHEEDRQHLSQEAESRSSGSGIDEVLEAHRPRRSKDAGREPRFERNERSEG